LTAHVDIREGNRVKKYRIGFVASTLTLLLLALPGSAAAYVGPGVGLTVIGAALAFIGAILLGIFGFVWYPLKRLVRALSGKSAREGDGVDV